MTKRLFTITAAFLITAMFASESFAISKVGRKHSFINLYLGTSQINGSYSGLPFAKFIVDGREIDVDGDEIYESGKHFGLQYGNLVGKNLSIALGLKYTRHDLKDTIYVLRDAVVDGEPVDFYYDFEGFDLTFSQYDFEADFNYMFMDLAVKTIAPYIGAGFKAGLSNGDFPGFEAENDFTFSLNLNFGADLKVWQSADKTDFLTLSSMNSFDFFSNDNKARYINIGGALKYYFRP